MIKPLALNVTFYLGKNEQMDKMRWRYGDTNPVVAAVQADTVIEMGDLLWLDGRVAKPACELWGLIVFKNNFLGVAMQRSPKGHTAAIRVAPSGVFEFPCTAHSVELGNLVTVATENGLKLANQIVRLTGEKCFAIGRVAKRSDDPVSSVLVSIVSTIMSGGIQ